MLNKNDYVPLYEQMRRLLRTQIVNGYYTDGDKLPSENHLMRTYGITRTTIRRAISALVQEGLVKQIHGKGTFVSLKKISKSIWNFQGFSTLARERNEEPVSRVIENTVNQKEDGLYLRLVRLRGIHKDGVTTWMTLDHSDLPLKVFPGLDKFDFEKQSLYDVLKKDYQCPPHHVNLEIKPILCDQRMSVLFELEGRPPLLQASGVVYNEEGKEIEKIEVVYAPHFTFKFAQNI